jgi:hypothetical protein
MQTVSGQRGLESPEKLISGLVARLRNHAFRDSLLICLPPVFALTYLAGYLYHAAFISEWILLLFSLVAAGILLAAGVLLYRPLVPSMRSAAGLLDDRAGAKDRFVTLATIEPAACAPLLVSRLRQEAAGLLNRIEIQREFPYKIKPSFYRSLLVSAVVLLLLHLFLPIVQSRITPIPAPERIRELARKMAERPRLSELARGLHTLANKFEDPKVSQAEQQALVQELRKKIEEQQKKESGKDERDLLGQASSTLKGLDQQSGNGQDQRKDQEKGGGSIQSNLPQEGQGEAKQSQGNGGDNKGELKAQLNKEMQQGESAQGDAKGDARGQSSEKNQQTKGDDKSRQGDPNKPDGDKSKETAGKREGQSEEPGGKSKASEETPKGTPPSDRLGGQGKEGIKNPRYVTVQLPDEPAADSKGKPVAGKESSAGRSRTTLPVSNVPLPAHIPDAPTEVQQMPLEYRGMIR